MGKEKQKDNKPKSDSNLRELILSKLASQEIDVKTPLRAGEGDEYLFKLISQATESKLNGRDPMKSGPRKCVRQMSSIGG